MQNAAGISQQIVCDLDGEFHGERYRRSALVFQAFVGRATARPTTHGRRIERVHPSFVEPSFRLNGILDQNTELPITNTQWKILDFRPGVLPRGFSESKIGD